MSEGALSGVRVVEFAGLGPGPFACMLLADHGAEVIRIERPGGDPLGRGDAVSTRGRKVHTLDLKCDAGRNAALELIADAHILIEGFRPGVMEGLGLGPAPCHARNPALVFGRITGWGQSGPLAPTAGHDINYIALAGVLHAIGPAGHKPVVPLNLVGDYGGGAMFLLFGVLAALHAAQRTGRGQVVDAAMVDGSLSLMAMTMGRIAQGRWDESARGSNSLDGGAPWYDTYRTADGQYIAVGAIEPAFYAELCTRLGLSSAEAAWRDARATWPRLRERLAAAFGSRTRAHWCAVFDGSDACVSPVLTLAEAAAHPHNMARANIVERDGLMQPAVAPRIAAAVAAPSAAATVQPEQVAVGYHHADGGHDLTCHPEHVSLNSAPTPLPSS